MDLLRLMRRLSKIGPGELYFRGRRNFSVRRDRRRPVYADIHFLDGLLKPTNPDSYTSSWEKKTSFFFTPDERESMLEIFREEFPDYLPAIISKAETVCNYRLPVFDRIIPFEKIVDWQQDPLTQNKWPLAHWSEIQVVNGEFDIDAKWVWELNRMQFLFPLGISYWATGDERFAECAISHILSWVEQNPPGIGINWVESQEIALRMTSWMWLLELIRGATALSSERLLKILDSLVQQGAHLFRYPSFYISPNTHLIGEAFGLFMFGCLYPEFGQSGVWQEFGQKTLEQELHNQFETDGVHSELSSYYHCYSIEYYLQFVVLARKCNLHLSSGVVRSLTQMYDFLLHICRPDGTLPMLGDGDGGRALPLSSASYTRPASLFGSGAVLLKRFDLLQKAENRLEDGLWLFGPAYKEGQVMQSADEDHSATMVYPDANYMIHHFGNKKFPHHLLFNAGKMGFLSAGHSHADYMHVELSLFGKPFLVDSGTYSYKDPVWRNYARSTAAHNTVAVDGADQAAFQGNFGWQKVPETAVGKWCAVDDCCLFMSRHNCYPEVRHKRSLLIYKDLCIFITDDFQAMGEHLYHTHYNLAPDITVHQRSNASYTLADPAGWLAQLQFISYESAEISIAEANEDSPEGWCFPRYGSRQKSHGIRLAEKVTGHTLRQAVIIPENPAEQAGGATLRVERLQNVEQIEVHFLLGKVIYQYFYGVPCRFMTASYIISCKIAVSEWKDNSLQSLTLFDATRLEYLGKRIFTSDVPVLSVMLHKEKSRWVVSTHENLGDIVSDSLDGLPIVHVRRKK